MPYFSYISMLHLYESLGWWRAGAELRKVGAGGRAGGWSWGGPWGEGRGGACWWSVGVWWGTAHRSG